MKTQLVTAALATVALVGSIFAAPKSEEEEVKIPEPETPIIMVGDSMMKLLGREMEKGFKKADIQPAVSFSSLGSGLVRQSVFDWPAKIDELLKENKPKTVFVALGTNDRQAIETPDGAILYENRAAWRAAYSKCIGDVMDQFLNNEVTRVIWFLLPPMKDKVNQEHAVFVNEIVTEQALAENRKDKVTLFDMGDVLSKRPGVFTSYMFGTTPQPITVRDPDGVHLTSDGGRLMIQTIVKKYWKKDLTKIK